MTPHEYLQKHVCTLDDGVAWKRCLFEGTAVLPSAALVDAAVDIAWTRLMPESHQRPALVVAREGTMMVFRLPKALPKAA